MLAGEGTTTPEGVAFAESRMAGYLGEPTVLLDITVGPRRLAAGISAAAATLECDLVCFLDVGGDVLAKGDEPGLASPLCDAVMLAAAAMLEPGLSSVAGVYGAGCDGELTPEEVLDRLAEVAAAGAMLGAWGLTPAACETIEKAASVIPTEASLQAVRCARGESGEVQIRGGRSTVRLTPVGALSFFFDPGLTLEGGAAPLAHAVRDAPDLESARDELAALGVETELDLERARAAKRARDRR